MRAGDRRAAEILAFPALQGIPAPDIPLRDVAHDKYMELAKGLLNSGKLNSQTRMLCEQIAILHAANHRRYEMNLPISARSLDQIGKLMKELRLVDSSDTVAPASSGEENRFSRFGQIVRRGAEATIIRSS